MRTGGDAEGRKKLVGYIPRASGVGSTERFAVGVPLILQDAIERPGLAIYDYQQLFIGPVTAT
jgi:hypothetical protein